MAICYIAGAGDFYGSFCPNADDLVIAADGGYRELMARGIRCDILLGDMDSLGEKPKMSADSLPEVLTFPVEKDETDTHLAYMEGVRRGYTEFYIYGGVGGREDHTFANYSLLLCGKNAGHKLTLIGNQTEIFVIKNEAISLCGKADGHLSVFALGSDAEGVDILGAKYEASGITLSPAFALGVSNSFIGGAVTVSVRCGALLIMKEI